MYCYEGALQKHNIDHVLPSGIAWEAFFSQYHYCNVMLL